MNEILPLQVEKLRKAYRRRPVLADVSIAVAPGQAVAVLGPNGAGKSTFLGCITGDRLPDGGAVRICGADPFTDLPTAARCMGVVPEQPFLYGELTVGEMLQFAGAARNLPTGAAAAEAERLISLLGLTGAEELLCRELSQGMGRKLALIVALLHGPRLIILDEAFNGLDLPSAERLRDELDARREGGAAVLLSSHDLSFIATWCERGLLLAPDQRWRMLDGEEWRAWGSAPSLAFPGE
ncbi:ABC transporter ATP-binding protein [soil metagenome]|nr:ABC transporter ATP-binding protein [Gemmatimonadota bacterium]